VIANDNQYLNFCASDDQELWREEIRIMGELGEDDVDEQDLLGQLQIVRYRRSLIQEPNVRPRLRLLP
jgi:hypothetical protein